MIYSVIRLVSTTEPGSADNIITRVIKLNKNTEETPEKGSEQHRFLVPRRQERQEVVLIPYAGVYQGP